MGWDIYICCDEHKVIDLAARHSAGCTSLSNEELGYFFEQHYGCSLRVLHENELEDCFYAPEIKKDKAADYKWFYHEEKKHV